MDTLRGLTVWLGAPALASLLCSAVWQVASGGHLMEWRLVFATAVVSFFFTLGGSTFLSLAFARINLASIAGRYIVLIGLGAVAGAGWMLMIGPMAALIGISYGTATACAWVALHQAVYGSK